jgi:hypothetical protein
MNRLSIADLVLVLSIVYLRRRVVEDCLGDLAGETLTILKFDLFNFERFNIFVY